MEIYGLMGAELQFCQMKNVLEMDGADENSHTQCECI